MVMQNIVQTKKAYDGSIDYLQTLLQPAMTPDEYVTNLAAQGLQHKAVHHPYLTALETGNLPNLEWALKDFAQQYISYSKHFPRYLTGVISRLEKKEHRDLLIQNLMEESGNYQQEELDELSTIGVDPKWIVGIPHCQLFKRFGEALGVNFAEATTEADEVICWRDMFFKVLTSDSPAQALGALGLGTEGIVSTMYIPFVKAIELFGKISPKDAVFFKLHTAVDDHHQQALYDICIDYAKIDINRDYLRYGMLKALSLRTIFWDWMYTRALNPKLAQE
jgi:pyrroloquinoline quinone (PQQ) biosynthesis protein C